MKAITLEQSLNHISKVEKWLALTSMQRMSILKQVNEKRGKNYKTMTAALGACLKLV